MVELTGKILGYLMAFKGELDNWTSGEARK